MIRGFALFLIVSGIAMGAFGISFIGSGTQAGSWPVVEGRVVAKRVESSVISGTRSVRRGEARPREYYPVIRYAWVVDGVEYTGERYRLGTTHEKFRERGEAQAAASRFRVGASIPVSYDPDNPSEAVLETAVSFAIYAPLIIGLLFLATGGLLWQHREAVNQAIASGKAEPVDFL